MPADDVQDIEVLILGAGINGAGLFRDLCEQGINCALIDKGDYGAGTSAAPSRLIHGGIKYLETGEFGLVAQSTLERNLLLKNASHYVTPLQTVIPIFSWTKGISAAIRTLFGSTTAPRNRGALLMKMGLSIYDFYGSRHRVMPRHELWLKNRALSEIAPLTKKIVAAGRYYDAKVSHPERMVLELIQDGVAANPASFARNHIGIMGADGDTVRFESQDGSLTLKPKIVVNAAGPWIDHVNAALGVKSKMIGGTKGSHILLDHSALIEALDGRMIYFEADDGRICLVFDHLGKALVGSSDIRADDPDDVACEEDEISYFLDSLRALLPGLSFQRDDVVYAYSGIRPLPNSDGVDPGLISRDHSAPTLEPDGVRPYPIVALVGGKWTTFRGFAEEVADSLLARLGSVRRVSTQTLPIGGGRDMPSGEAARAQWVQETAHALGVDETRCAQLLARYGTKARDVLAFEAQTNGARLEDAPTFSLAEIEWIVRHEQVVHLEDVVMRRTSLAILGLLTVRDLAAIADLVGEVKGWNAQTKRQEMEATHIKLERVHQMRLL